MPETSHEHQRHHPDRPEPARPAAEAPAPQERRRPESEQPDPSSQRQSEHPPVSEAQLTPEEQEEKENARQEVKAALEQLHAMLKTAEQLAASQITAAIDQTPLSQLTPPFKHQLAFTIERRQLQGKDEQAFVDRGLQVLDFWIHLQGLKRGTNRQLENLRQNFPAG
jgi:hypothetical protein